MLYSPPTMLDFSESNCLLICSREFYTLLYFFFLLINIFLFQLVELPLTFLVRSSIGDEVLLLFAYLESSVSPSFLKDNVVVSSRFLKL